MKELYFGLDTGNLYAPASIMRTLERGSGPPNLQQLQAIGKVLLIDTIEVEGEVLADEGDC